MIINRAANECYHEDSIIFLILDWFLLLEVDHEELWSLKYAREQHIFHYKQKYCSVSFIFALCQFSKKYLLYVFSSSNFFGTYFVLLGCRFIYNNSVFLPFCVVLRKNPSIGNFSKFKISDLEKFQNFVFF